jgi:hypothetical protein
LRFVLPIFPEKILTNVDIFVQGSKGRKVMELQFD